MVGRAGGARRAFMAQQTLTLPAERRERSGKGPARARVLPREAQLHPVTDEPLHVDFLRASQGATLTIAVPVRFVHEDQCTGLRRGGVLNIVRREVELVCPADAIPGELIVDLAGRDI